MAVGNLDADGRLARDGGHDAKMAAFKGQGQVVLEGGDAGDLDPRGGLDLVLGHSWTRVHPHHLGVHPEIGQGFHDGPADGLIIIDHLILGFVGGFQDMHRRQLPLTDDSLRFLFLFFLLHPFLIGHFNTGSFHFLFRRHGIGGALGFREGR